MNIELNSPDLRRRAAVHAALGDALRLAIVDALALSDRTPSELGRSLDLPSNLLAHHLGILEEAGVLSRTPSRADGRRRYVRLIPEALDTLLAVPVLHARAVLFVCHHNSARSLLAQALWSSASVIPADSAGLLPATSPHPQAVATAARHGLDVSTVQPKGYESVSTAPDVIITVCDRTHEAAVPEAPIRLHWSVPDPVIAGDDAAFEATYAELDRRVARAARHINPDPFSNGTAE